MHMCKGTDLSFTEQRSLGVFSLTNNCCCPFCQILLLFGFFASVTFVTVGVSLVMVAIESVGFFQT